MPAPGSRWPILVWPSRSAAALNASVRVRGQVPRRLNRIAGRGPRPVRFDKRQTIGINTIRSVNALKQRVLRFERWQRNAAGAAVGIDVCSDDETMDRIARGLRLCQPPQDDDTAAFRADKAIRLARSKRRNPVGDSIEACEKAINEDGLVMTLVPPTIAVSMKPDRNTLDYAMMQRHQRRRAGGVHRDAGAAQIENVGNPVGQNGERSTGREVQIRDRLVGHERMRVIDLRRTDIDTDILASECRGANASILERFPSQLQ